MPHASPVNRPSASEQIGEGDLTIKKRPNYEISPLGIAISFSDILDMFMRCRPRNAHYLTDFIIRFPATHKYQSLMLARRERRGIFASASRFASGDATGRLKSEPSTDLRNG